LVVPGEFRRDSGLGGKRANGLPALDHSPRVTQNRRQVDGAVRSNIVEFLDRLAAFTATRPYRTAQDLAAETAIER
jgi:hypothetical protein